MGDKGIAINVADFGVNANGRQYKLDSLSKEELAKLKTGFDVHVSQFFTEDELGRMKKAMTINPSFSIRTDEMGQHFQRELKEIGRDAFYAYRPVGAIPHGLSGAKTMMNLALAAFPEGDFEIEPRIVNGRVTSWDFLKSDSDIPPDVIMLDSLGDYDGIRVGDPIIGRKFHFTYETMGGHYGTIGDMNWWENKNDTDQEKSKRAVKRNIKEAKDNVTGKTAASALFKSLLGRKK